MNDEKGDKMMRKRENKSQNPHECLIGAPLSLLFKRFKLDFRGRYKQQKKKKRLRLCQSLLTSQKFPVKVKVHSS